MNKFFSALGSLVLGLLGVSRSRVKNLLLAVAGFLAACPPLAAAPVRSVRGYGPTITITEAGQHHRLTLHDIAVDMDDAVLLADQRRSGLRYLVFHVTGPTRRWATRGPCAAGIESAFVWLELSGWLITASEFSLIESCRSGATPLEPIRWRDGVCTIVFWDPRDNNSQVTLSYNSRIPAARFSTAKEPFNK